MKSVWVHPMYQAHRAQDGVCGLFARQHAPRGTLLLSIPLRWCYLCSTPLHLADRPLSCHTPESSLTHSRRCREAYTRESRLLPARLLSVDAAAARRKDAQQLRRCNRHCDLFPEMWQWLCALSSDAAVDGVSLTASASSLHSAMNEYGTSDNAENDTTQTQSRNNNYGVRECGNDAVTTVSVSPVEAALAVCVALRYFFATALSLSRTTRVGKGKATQALGPVPDTRADNYVATMPVQRYLSHGVEDSLFDLACDVAHVPRNVDCNSSSSASWCDDAEKRESQPRHVVQRGEVHTCVEQIACNLRDAVLTRSSSAEYRLLDSHAELFDAIILCALYVVRARVLPLRVLPRMSRNVTTDVATVAAQVFAPGLAEINHASGSLASAAAVLSVERECIAVRAIRDVRRHEEVTMNYTSVVRNGTDSGIPWQEVNGEGHVMWSSRYLI